MLKILYGVQGTGNGHISRARMMAKYLNASNNIDATFLFSGRERSKFFDMECFGDYIYRRGLTFVTEAGRVRKTKTLLGNNMPQCLQDIRELDTDGYDLIITDYEPVTAWAGKRNQQTVIGLGHQYAFGYNIPIAGGNLMSSTIMNHFAPADISIGLHWDHFGYQVLPPIIDPELAPAVQKENTVVVYLPFEDQQQVTQVLQHMPNVQFLQYSPELQNEEAGNVCLRKTCHGGFKRDLSQTQAVICNAGFELVSECLGLQLPIMVKPLQGQMEQLSNAAALQQLGYADVMHSLDAQVIKQWLNTAKTAPSVKFPDVAKAVVEALETIDRKQLNSLPAMLTASLWPTPPLESEALAA